MYYNIRKEVAYSDSKLFITVDTQQTNTEQACACVIKEEAMLTIIKM
jgi:hypothetical protein